MMPELKQFSRLTPTDFERHPVWISCHSVDHDESWFGETDEETFRPWTGTLPASPSEGTLLVRATLELVSGNRYPGFVTPAMEEGDIGTLQPQLFAKGEWFAFWGGIIGFSNEQRQAFYTALREQAHAVFPIRFAADPDLATGVVSGCINGFYRIVGSHARVEL
jgi:hypothetical protein